jgi:glycosyltransferase involved in cell wall biosynthesis
MTRLLVVSHACVVPANQEFWGRLSELTGWHVDLVLPERWHNEYGDHVARRSRRFGGGLHTLPVVGSGRIPNHLYRGRIGRLLRKADPHVVYLHNEPYALATLQWACALRNRVPFGFYAAQNLFKAYPAPSRSAERMVHRRASFALPVSDEVGEVLRKRGYAGPLDVLPLSVDTAAFRLRTRVSERARVVGFLGRLSPEKGVDTLLEACAQIRDLDYKCVVAGDGPARQELHRLAQRLRIEKRLEWKGYVNHARAAELYSDMDVVVVPSRTTSSWKEQFGRVVVEALAAGVPVVTSDSGELPRLVKRTGGGWTFPEGDADALARRLNEIVRRPDLRQRASRSGATYVREHLDLDAVVASFADAVRRHALASVKGSGPRKPRIHAQRDC